MIIFNNTQWFHNNGQRPAFDQAVDSLRENGYDLCHRISYYTIANGICNALNFLWYHNFKTVDETVDETADDPILVRGVGYIAGMILSVYGEPGEFDNIQGENELVFLKRIIEQVTDGIATGWFSDKIEQMKPEERGEVSEAFSTLLNKVKQYEKPEFPTEIVNAANDLLYLLNSCRSNLRAGQSCWNRSLSSAYDPTDWAYYENEENPQGYFGLSESDSIQITNLINFTMGEAEGVPNTKNALFFYSAYDEDSNCVLYSSQNGEKLLNRACYEICTQEIRYVDYLNKIWESILLDDDERQKQELARINEKLQ